MSNVGIGDGALRFTTGSMGEWEVVAWGGRFAVCRFSNERMRITDQGVFFGDTLKTPDNALEVHWFNTREWANLARRRLESIDGILYNKPMFVDSAGHLGVGQGNQPAQYSFIGVNGSEWQCYLFGSTPQYPGITYTPEKGKEPNRFVRWCMKIMLACTWVRK